MMSTRLRLKRAAYTGIFGVFVGALQGGAQAADSIVPSAWNVTPAVNGAYREAFDSTLPPWASGGSTEVTASFVPSISVMPVRPNVWFDASAKVLRLNTEDVTVTNTLTSNPAGPVQFGAAPVYLDFRVKFDTMTGAPNPALLDNVKLAIYVSSDAKLVAVHKDGSRTNNTALDPDIWHQVTVKMYGTQFDVLMNDVPVFTGLSLKTGGAANTLAAVSFNGTGLIDELYVSHGNPAYPGVMGAVPATVVNFPGTGGSAVTNWLANYFNDGRLSGTANFGGFTSAQLDAAYLLGELGGDANTPVPVAYDFGISKIDMASPTSLIITLSLTTKGADKSGPINGKIQLLGKINIGDGWTTLGGAVTPSYADFTAGKATYTFTIPEGGFTFFKPQIVP